MKPKNLSKRDVSIDSNLMGQKSDIKQTSKRNSRTPDRLRRGSVDRSPSPLPMEAESELPANLQRRGSVLLYDSIPDGNFKPLLKKMPKESYKECSTKDTPMVANAQIGAPGVSNLTVDIFLSDFMFNTLSPKEGASDGTYLMYIYEPHCTRELETRIAESHRVSGLTANGQEHMNYVRAHEGLFVEEHQGINEHNRSKIIRVAFRMKNGRMDPLCRAVLDEYPILSLPANEEWPLTRIFIIAAEPVKHECFMKRGNLSKQELSYIENKYHPHASTLWFLDRGESGRVAVLSAEHAGVIRLNTVQIVRPKKDKYIQSRRCELNGRITLRLAVNTADKARRLLPSSAELDRMQTRGTAFLSNAHSHIEKHGIGSSQVEETHHSRASKTSQEEVKVN